MFSAEPLAGNGLAVVADADDLSDRAMLAFARETQLSETSFIQQPSEPGADYRHRIFTVEGEIAFAGHPSLGAAVAVARRQGREDASYVQQTQAGQQRIDVLLEGTVAAVSMLQAPAELGDALDPRQALAALSLPPAAAHPELPATIGSTGLRHLLLPLVDERALDVVSPRLELLRAVCAEHGAMTLYAFVPDGEVVQARAFFEALGTVREDPATGSAAGPLAAYLALHRGRSGQVAIVQGRSIGRRGDLRAEVVPDGVRVGGRAVILIEGELHF